MLAGCAVRRDTVSQETCPSIAGQIICDLKAKLGQRAGIAGKERRLRRVRKEGGVAGTTKLFLCLDCQRPPHGSVLMHKTFVLPLDVADNDEVLKSLDWLGTS